MTKKAKFWIGFAIAANPIAMVLMITLGIFRPFTRMKLLNLYSNKNNYSLFKGTIEKIDKESLSHNLQFSIFLENVEIYENNQYVPYSLDDDHTNRWVYSPNASELIVTLEDIHKEISFLANMNCWEGYCDFSIVQISVGDIELLTFEDGQNAILTWYRRPL